MATHSSVLAWRIPGTGEPGGLPSMGSHRVEHNWSDLAATAATFKTPSCSSRGTSFSLSSLSSGVSSSVKPSSPTHFFPLQRLFVPGILLWVTCLLSLQSVLQCPSTWESGWLRAGAWMLNGWMDGSLHSTIWFFKKAKQFCDGSNGKQESVNAFFKIVSFLTFLMEVLLKI